MNANLLFLVGVLAAPPGDQTQQTLYSPNPAFSRVIRGQSPETIYQTPPLYSPGPTFAPPGQSGVPFQHVPPTTVYPDGGGIPVGPQMSAPFASPPTYTPVLPPVQPSAPLTVDPFLNGSGGLGMPFVPASSPPGLSAYSYSVTGQHPFRYGMTHRFSAGFLTGEDVQRAGGSTRTRFPTANGSGRVNQRPLGDFEVFEFDYENEYTTPVFDNSVFSYTSQIGQRSWDGPQNAPIAVGDLANVRTNAIDLPGHVHRFGWDFELTTAVDSPLSYQFGFNPSINTDFDRSLSSDAYNWDGRAISFLRISPRTTLASGLIYWDRVHDRLLPYAGVIYVPDPRYEYLLVFPNPRISYLISNPGELATWAYVRGEYHVEAYEIEREPQQTRLPPADNSFREKIELEDWRVLLGLRTENPYGVSAFWEAGWVFGRNVDFLNGTPGFDVTTGFITRAGLHF